MAIKAPSIFPRLAEFARNSANVPYENLAGHFNDAFPHWRLRQVGAPLALYDGGVAITFDFMVGEDWSSLEVIDTVSHRLNNVPGPISFAARHAMRDALVYIVFGRVPPQLERPPAAAPAAPQHMNGANEAPELDVDMTHGDVSLPEDDGGEYVQEPADAPAVVVVDRREPDGLPIFVDLYGLGAPATTAEVIEAVLDEVSTFMDSASLEQVDALALKNPDLVPFITDLGSPENKAELRALITARKAALASAPVARRRVAGAGSRAN